MSFCSAAGDLLTDGEHLPLLMALYDALNDDDDEVRDVAAAATIRILGRALAPLEAADRLLDHLAAQFGELPAFHNVVACRLAGVSPRLAEWPDVRLAVEQAINFDDSLFAQEEQNLFVDEVRELRRFQRVARGLPWKADDDCVRRLIEWTTSGLRLIGEEERRDDGPLGLASDQHYFALCARLVISGVVLSKTAGASPTATSLQQLVGAITARGGKTDFHGSLAAMAGEVGSSGTQ